VIHLNQVLRLCLCMTFLLSVVFVALCCIYYRRLHRVRLFFPYGLLLLVAAAVVFYPFNKAADNLNIILLNSFLLAEFYICMLFLRRFTKSDEAGRALIFAQQLFPLVFVYCWMYAADVNIPNTVLYKLHHVLICFGCLTLYFEFYKHLHSGNVFRFPPLLAINGIMSYSLLCFIFSAALFHFEPFSAYHALQLKFVAGSILFTWLFIAAIHELRHS
jgi:hypothetical protein